MAGIINYDANQSDFFGEGLARPAAAPRVDMSALEQQERDLAKARFDAFRAGVPYGTPASQGGSATQYQVTQTQGGELFPGTSTIVRQMNPDGTPSTVVGGQSAGVPDPYGTGAAGTTPEDRGGFYAPPTSLTAPGSYNLQPTVDDAGRPVSPRVGVALNAGISLADQVQGARQTGTSFLGYGDQALNRTQQQTNTLLDQSRNFHPQAASVLPSLPAGPGQIAPQLGAAPKVGAVGAVAPQMGTLGAQNAGQQSFLDQLQSRLSGPQGPSVAEAQLRQAQANNAAELLGAARSGRGTAADQAERLREAMSQGSALMSDTAGQLATLRAQEEDMRANRDLNALGLGGQLSTAQRGQDLTYGGQRLGALQGDQSTALGLENLRAQTALGARGQNLSALQSDQGAYLGQRAQDLSALTGDADRALAAQQLGLQGQLGLGQLGLQAQGQGLQYSSQQNALGLGAEGLAQDAINQSNANIIRQAIAQGANATQLQLLQQQLDARPSFGEKLLGNVVGAGLQFGGMALGGALGGPAGAAAGGALGDAAGNSLFYTQPPY